MEFREAFVRLQSEPKLAQRFIDDPEGVLGIMGVDTTDLVIQPTVGAKAPFSAMSEFARRGPADSAAAGPTICVSVGFIVCATVGGELDLVTEGALATRTVAARKTRT